MSAIVVISAASTFAADTRDYLASIKPSSALQELLDRSIDALASTDANLRRTNVRVALLDLSADGGPLLAHRNGDVPVYPASVVKFAYLMAAYAWQESGRPSIDAEMDAQLTLMIHDSSNQATQKVFARLTDTEAGPRLPADEYRSFRDRRLAVVRWLQGLGIDDLHCANPTYDGNGDLIGRDEQFVSDHDVVGGLPDRAGDFSNRNAMTAIGTAKLLALLATDRALTPEDSATVRRRMRRDPADQPHLIHRIAAVTRTPGVDVYAKSGTWGPIYADAGIIRYSSGHQLVLVVFTEGTPPYRGDFIAKVAQRCTDELLVRRRHEM